MDTSGQIYGVDVSLVHHRSGGAHAAACAPGTLALLAPDGSWRRARERHRSVLVDAGTLPALLARHGIDARVGDSFGNDRLPDGLRTLTGRRRGSA